MRVSVLATSILLCSSGASFAGPFTVVGGGSFATLADAVAAASSGATINVAAGTYADQSATVAAGTALTIQSVGGLAIFNAISPLANTQGIIKTFGDLTVNGLQFENAHIDNSLGGNGAGIRYKSGSLTVLNSIFLNNQEGILGDADPTGTVLIDHSSFIGNGNPTGGGLEHAVYITQIADVTVQNSTFTGTKGAGSNIQSRAARTTVVDNVMDNGTISDSNYAVNIPNGGIAVVTGNTIDKGPQTTNHRIVAYGAAGLGALHDNNSLTVTGNVFTSTDPHAIGIQIFSPDDLVATLTPNLFNGTFDSEIVGPVGPQPPPPPVPEPPALALLLASLASMFFFRRSLFLRSSSLRSPPARRAGFELRIAQAVPSIRARSVIRCGAA